MSERIFITGISGFIGEELAQRCIKEGFEVAGLIRQHPQHPETIKNLRGKVALYEGDITDSTRLGNIIRDFNPDYVVHLAALSRVSYSFGHEEETFLTNAGGTIRLVEALKKYGTNLKMMIYASSMETFGHKPEFHKTFEPFDEETTFGVGSPYAVWKICCDYYIRQQHYANGFPGVVFRQTNTYGRKYDDYFVVEAFITQMLQHPDEVNFGNPEPVRNFMHIDDLIDCYINMLRCKNPEVMGKAFTLGPPNGITIKELQEKIADIINWKGKVNWYTREIRDGEIYYLNSKNNLITELTGWEPKIDIDTGLKRTVEFWKEKKGEKNEA